MAGNSGVSLKWGGLDKAMGGAAHALGAQGRKALLTEVGEALISGTHQRFMDEEDPEGKAWKKSKRAQKKGGKTLRDKGQLQGSIDKAVASHTVMVGSNLPYARVHNDGGQAGRGRKVTMPKRTYLGISEEDQEEINAILADHLKNAFTG